MILTFEDELWTNRASMLCPRCFATTPRRCSQNVLPETTTRIRNPLHLRRWFHRLEELTHLTPAVSASAAGQRERIWQITACSRAAA
jgi:hypothetical protein